MVNNTAQILSSLVGADGRRFSSTEKDEAVDTAQTYLSTTDGDSNPKDMATAMLAQRILMNLRKPDDQQQPLDDLVTDEIRSLATDTDDFSSDEDGFVTDNSPPDSSETWY